MTNTAKTTLWIIIILVIVGGIWWFVGSNQPPQAPAPVQQQANVQATTTEVVPQDASTTISIQDKSDTALSTDLSKVDDQLKILSLDSSN